MQKVKKLFLIIMAKAISEGHEEMHRSAAFGGIKNIVWC